MKEKWEILKNEAFVLIDEEALPIPAQIKYRQSLSGVKRRMACCKKRLVKEANSNDRVWEYSIIINTTKAKYYEDEKGKYYGKTTKKRYTKSYIGEDIPFIDMIQNMAHEIAHIKFWEHNSKHLSYTMELFDKLKVKILNRGVDINE